MLISETYMHFWLVLLGLLHVVSGKQKLYEGDSCTFSNDYPGICKASSKCYNLLKFSKNNRIPSKKIPNCGYVTNEELICCPVEDKQSSVKPTTTTTTTTKTTTTPKPQPKQRSGPRAQSDRASVKACKKIEKSLRITLTTHILNGDIVKPGEYPHMAAIYAVKGKRRENKMICGGTLIHARFVLTSAHCVSRTREKTAFVRLGISNFDDTAEFPHRVDKPIKKIHIHPEYMKINKANDIALIEFEHPMRKTKFIAPTCLYTKKENPPTDAKLFVAGWGQFNKTKSRLMSRKLLKARISIVEQTSCQVSYIKQGYPLRVTQICAADERLTKNNGKRDTCRGDSGGPLIMVKDEDLKSYAVVGITSFGTICGILPGIYTKVYDYLDFIESIVWPSG